MKDYEAFLQRKRKAAVPTGFLIEPEQLGAHLYEWQRPVVRWALRRGCAALFEDCGLGKTAQQLEWAAQVADHVDAPVLIFAPLAVARQTQAEGEKFGIPVTVCRRMEDVREGVNVTNYDLLQHFQPAAFGGIVLDESSILKGDGTVRKAITEFAERIPFRLACTATPAPNDHQELINHAEFLGVMRGDEILSLWFTQDGNTTHKWRLKGHAREDFWRWVATWALAVRTPADLGYPADGYTLPPITYVQHVVDTGAPTDALFQAEARGIAEQRRVRRETLAARVWLTVNIVTSSGLTDACGGKIDVCGNQNTPQDNERSIALTPKCGHESVPVIELPKRTGNTCKPTTRPTKRSIKSTDVPTLKSEIGNVGNDTQPTQSSARSANSTLGTETSQPSATGGSKRSSELEAPSTTHCLSNRADGALSVAQSRPTSGDINSMSITATQPELSEGSSAADATWASVSSKTTLNGSGKPWIIWCELNDEQDALAEALGDSAISIYGSLSSDEKERRVLSWLRGDRPVLISKPSLIGFGMNFQHCADVVFSGLGNSYEKYYQAVRRCYRFGQKRPVTVHVVTSEADGPIVRNIERKEQQAVEMMSELIGLTDLTCAAASAREEMEYTEGKASGTGWDLLLGDSCKTLVELKTGSVGHSVFSPPFPSMYVYTNSPHDIGNCASFEEMLSHFRFLIPELLRVTMPGRSCSVHLTQALSFVGKDGHAGMKDFRGATIRAFEDAGWHYYGEVAIDKNPQLKAIRTKDRGLLFKTLATDSAHMHMAMADYLLQFRAPGDNPEPIRAGISDKYGNPDGWISQDEWIRWARPVWYAADFAPDGDGIAETDVLNVSQARDTNDERHLCPLQLGVIERSLKLWSNPGDLILSPFAGIGSEGYQAVRFGRRFIGGELKPSYFRQAVRNLKRAEAMSTQRSLAGALFGE
jgi:hypothetical protein